jgi:DNA repair exonuclease SbcCD ATPase subunit
MDEIKEIRARNSVKISSVFPLNRDPEYMKVLEDDITHLLTKIKELEDKVSYWKERYKIERGEVVALGKRIKELEDKVIEIREQWELKKVARIKELENALTNQMTVAGELKVYLNNAKKKMKELEEENKQLKDVSLNKFVSGFVKETKDYIKKGREKIASNKKLVKKE